MHDIGFDHLHPPAEDRAGLSDTIAERDSVELVTVGVDVGSSTSHLMFSRVRLQRLSEALSSRFVVTHRETIGQSPILLTPYRRDFTINAQGLACFFDDAYRAAGLSRDDIDSGAVILTGEALKRRNARAIADLFAAEGGKFVCASAGHHLEAVMAAHGSGAVAYSRLEQKTMLNVDIGGGTTKFALIENGKLVANAAVAIGGRLLAFDQAGRLARIEEPARQIATHAGVELRQGEELPAAARKRLVDVMADGLFAAIERKWQAGLIAELDLTRRLPATPAAEAICFSGGVSEYVYCRESADHGDLGRELAAAIVARLKTAAAGMPIFDPGQGIRATVIGASQFTVQVSGNTVFISDPGLLPQRNVPAVHLHLGHGEGDFSSVEVAAEIGRGLDRLDLDAGRDTLALAFSWRGEPSHERLHRLCQGICQGMAGALGARHPLLLVTDGDVGRSLGRILRHEFGVASGVVSIDGLQLNDYDYVDIGELIRPTNVVPLVIKSLLFSAPAD